MKKSSQNPEKEWKWPLGIFTGYSIFVIGTLSFVFFTFTQKTDLVAENYYEKTLTYQEQITRMQNAQNLDNPLTWRQTGRYLNFSFPADQAVAGLDGEIIMFRPSNSDYDRIYEIKTDPEGLQQIDAAELNPGLWKIQVAWNSGGVEYYREANIDLR